MRDIIKTIKTLLRRVLALASSGKGDRKADFSEFSGAWSSADAREFEEKTEDLRKVNPCDWR